MLKLWRSAKVPFDVFAYLLVIRGFVSEKKLIEAEIVLVDMEELRIALGADCYKAFIQGYCEAGNCIKSLAFHFEMCKKSIKTNCFIVSSILQYMCRMGFNYEAVEIMGICLDGVVYNITIDALSKLRKLQEDGSEKEVQVLGLLSSADQVFKPRLAIGFTTLLPVLHHVADVPFHPVQPQTIKLILNCASNYPGILSNSHVAEISLVLGEMLKIHIDGDTGILPETFTLACSLLVALMKSPSCHEASRFVLTLQDASRHANLNWLSLYGRHPSQLLHSIYLLKEAYAYGCERYRDSNITVYWLQAAKAIDGIIMIEGRISGEDARNSVKYLSYELPRKQWKPGIFVGNHSNAVQSHRRTKMEIVVDLSVLQKHPSFDPHIAAIKDGYCKECCSTIADSEILLLAGPTTVVTMINHSIGVAGVVSQECKAVVDQYGQKIMVMLLTEAPPEKICSQISLCTFDGTRGASVSIERVLEEISGMSSWHHDDMCSTCELTVAWMQNQMRQNPTQDRILSDVNELCDWLHRPMGESSVDRSKISTMPSVAFTIGDKIFKLPVKQYILKVGVLLIDTWDIKDLVALWSLGIEFKHTRNLSQQKEQPKTFIFEPILQRSDGCKPGGSFVQPSQFMVPFVTRMASGWYFSAMTLIFDPGGYDCYKIFKCYILEDKDDLKKWELLRTGPLD